MKEDRGGKGEEHQEDEREETVPKSSTFRKRRSWHPVPSLHGT